MDILDYGVIGVLSSTLATSSAISKCLQPYLPAIAAVCFSILGFINPQKMAALYIRAFRLPEPAIRQYEHSLITLSELIEIHKVAEELLNNTQQLDGGYTGKDNSKTPPKPPSHT